ncbi:unnamed protein product [Camellia sinensis]
MSFLSVTAMEEEHDNQKQVPISLENLHLQDQSQRQKEYQNTITESIPNLKEVEEIIGYNFKDQSLLRQAFTDGSFQEKCSSSSSSSYERLEYIGDSVLNLLIAKQDYFSYPDLLPGKLTRLRAANVDTEKLARVAVKLNLHRYLRHNKPLLDGQIREFMDAIKDYPLHSSGLVDAPKVLADIVESTIGAIYVDSNSSMDITWKVVKSLLEPIITPATLQTHPVTKFYELCQKHAFEVRLVDLWKETGAIDVFVDSEFVATGIYTSKKLIALNRAANNAYNEIVRKLSAENNNDDQ